MLFKAIDSVPGKITKGHEYDGGFVMMVRYIRVDAVAKSQCGLRIAVYGDDKKWMTFNPKIFVPVT